ncbi:MAG: hypothetical protein BME93_05940 [Methanosarcinales archaeon Met12]|nr:MAG: hypothetical protein BME93_05940 [Methanosarcinales archaeon Met12]
MESEQVRKGIKSKWYFGWRELALIFASFTYVAVMYSGAVLLGFVPMPIYLDPNILLKSMVIWSTALYCFVIYISFRSSRFTKQ